MGDLSNIVNLITTVGFPIVCVLFLGIYVKQQSDQQREDIKDLNKQHVEEMSKFQEALNNNTIALTKLCEKLDARYDDGR